MVDRGDPAHLRALMLTCTTDCFIAAKRLPEAPDGAASRKECAELCPSARGGGAG